MLIALMTILLLGAGSSGLLDYIAETEDTIKVVMEKDDRRKAVLVTVKEMKKRTKARNKQVNKSRKELSKMLTNHDASKADIDAVWDTFYADVESYNQDMLNLRFELRDRITREEWQAIFSGDDSE